MKLKNHYGRQQWRQHVANDRFGGGPICLSYVKSCGHCGANGTVREPVRPSTTIGERQPLGSQSLKKKLANDKPKGEAIAYQTAANAGVMTPMPMTGPR